jgi:hypothetical protein
MGLLIRKYNLIIVMDKSHDIWDALWLNLIPNIFDLQSELCKENGLP